jgi:hypothetical protein
MQGAIPQQQQQLSAYSTSPNGSSQHCHRSSRDICGRAGGLAPTSLCKIPTQQTADIPAAFLLFVLMVTL